MKAAQVLIVGYGNPLRGDDALGRLAASRLAQRFAGLPRVTVMEVHQLTLDLAEAVNGCELLILLDARQASPAGKLFCAPVAPATAAPNPFVHYCTPGELLAATALLYGSAPRAFLAGITATGFNVGAPLSPEVAAALDDLAQLVADLVEETQ